MKDEVIHFYLENKTPIDKIIAIGIGKMGLTRTSIEEALERVYDEIQGGEEINPIRVAWKVYALAKHLRVYADAKENDNIKKLTNEVTELKKQIDWYKQPWWKRFGRRYASC